MSFFINKNIIFSCVGYFIGTITCRNYYKNIIKENDEINKREILNLKKHNEAFLSYIKKYDKEYIENLKIYLKNL